MMAMPVYMFTFNAYGSWMPDHKRGFVKKGEGIQKTNPALAKAYRQAAKHATVLFDEPTQRFLLCLGHEVCGRRRWRVHGIAAEPTHIHFLVSWANGTDWTSVRGKLLNILSTGLSKRSGELGRPWFVDGSSRKRVGDREHFGHLITEYLPAHDGAKWFEGDAPPPPPTFPDQPPPRA